jgi:Fe-S-cluster-containing dehydrogenase component
MHFGDLDDPNAEVSQLLASRKHHAVMPEAGTRPRIFFLE